ncbi:ORF156 [Saltwater crocodilepox virus]|nr:hypothetical protein [Saltwater crocodilepox virus]QGT46811.1 ORF156 [Saltwater crocodilepox virus]QGT48308.1 ORF156 [Saltwater crocodilepox virus]QGT48524.1 ORF156 [Saltwater crocodilepox virus]QGT48738.1 ORF156 [Saltwater crocodilepox virus]
MICSSSVIYFANFYFTIFVADAVEVVARQDQLPVDVVNGVVDVQPLVPDLDVQLVFSAAVVGLQDGGLEEAALRVVEDELPLRGDRRREQAVVDARDGEVLRVHELVPEADLHALDGVEAAQEVDALEEGVVDVDVLGLRGGGAVVAGLDVALRVPELDGDRDVEHVDGVQDLGVDDGVVDVVVEAADLGELLGDVVGRAVAPRAEHQQVPVEVERLAGRDAVDADGHVDVLDGHDVVGGDAHDVGLRREAARALAADREQVEEQALHVRLHVGRGRLVEPRVRDELVLHAVAGLDVDGERGDGVDLAERVGRDVEAADDAARDLQVGGLGLQALDRVADEAEVGLVDEAVRERVDVERRVVDDDVRDAVEGDLDDDLVVGRDLQAADGGLVVEGRAQVHVDQLALLDDVVRRVARGHGAQLLAVAGAGDDVAAARRGEELLALDLPDRPPLRGELDALDALVAHVGRVREAADALDLGQRHGEHEVVHGVDVLVLYLVPDHVVAPDAADRDVLRHVVRGLLRVDAEDVLGLGGLGPPRAEEGVDDRRVHL